MIIPGENNPAVFRLMSYITYICCLYLLFATVENVMATETTNRLATENSPYLLKHSTNPVHWFPWSEEAFALARRENKPIFLSIGYSTCHWCNVMEEESFSDPEVAAMMNDIFVSIKVDREERPDIDQIYMQVCQMLSASCGWPLTIFMTPDKKPFFAGTYFPKEDRFGRPGIMSLMRRLKELWQSDQAKILASADSIKNALSKSTTHTAGETLDASQLTAAYTNFADHFDRFHGGFGNGIKFPRPHNLMFLLRYWKHTGNDNALHMVEETLQHMRNGGIYDQLGFGFHRYSTDAAWLVPHFEKMLYDQALLIITYAEAFQATGRRIYGETAREIINYIQQHMTAPTGGFFSAESADSEGEEGKFYVWHEEEIQQILSPEETEAARAIFNFTPEGNFVDPLSDKKTGANILFRKKELSPTTYETIRRKLLTARNKRPRPERDEKILTDWNGLMIAALARAAQVLDEPSYGKAAARAAAFILQTMRDKDGKLLHRWYKGNAGLSASATDYVNLIWGLLELYQRNFDTEYLQEALQLNTELAADFWDEKSGGFFLTPSYGEALLVRTKDFHDGALPSANAVAMLNLLRIGRITGDHSYEEKASAIMKIFANDIRNSPADFSMFMTAVEFGLRPGREVVVVGQEQAEDTRTLLRALRKTFAPNMVVLLKSTDISDPPILKYARFLADMSPINNKATAYVCTNYTCKFPTNDPAVMLDLVQGDSPRNP
jgi:uncharacterized protein YyaL (SSP411 family)